jgi:UDP-N-acetylglucosamine--N-acetylmuramyl-(pentapeptide) pyrophosphoryl-undecaprenol N-acetylglucosamine transferase
MKIIIAGGGTGGHLYPGIAVAEEFMHRDPSNSILFVGTEHGIEARVIPQEGYPIRFLKAEGLVGKSVLKKMKAVFILGLSFFQAFRIISSEDPDIVIGVGGYASFSMVLAARISGVKTMIMEQNSIPGYANRTLGRFAGAIAVTYQESYSFFDRDKTYLTGNPVRKSILSRLHAESGSVYSGKGTFNVLVFGGSQGSRAINRAVIGTLHYLLDLRQNIRFLHQTGEAELKATADAYQQLGFKHIAEPFIYRMSEAYAAADMVICRAGATTLAELTVTGKAAVLIPYPYAASNHQEFNARKLEEMGAAMVITEKQLSGENLAKAIRELYENTERRAQMQKASKGVGRAGSAEKIVDIAMNLIKN